MTFASAPNVLASLLGDVTEADFLKSFFRARPLAQAGTANDLRSIFTWQTIAEIVARHHRDIALASNGRLHETGPLKLENLVSGFANGQSVVIRHAEQAAPRIEVIAEKFRDLLASPVDVQCYATPAGREGFDWHWDIEDVFVVQSGGIKEFYLWKNKFPPSAATRRPKNGAELADLTHGPIQACLLQGGDFLYIPAGYWHKARAITDSFHISIGVLSSRA